MRKQQAERAERERERIRMLTADPFDAEVQQKIAEEIRLDRVFFSDICLWLFFLNILNLGSFTYDKPIIFVKYVLIDHVERMHVTIHFANEYINIFHPTKMKRAVNPFPS